MLDVQCQCGTRFKLGDEWAGRQVKCPACGVVFTIGPTQAVAPAPTVAPAPSAPAAAPVPAPAPVAPTPAVKPVPLPLGSGGRLAGPAPPAAASRPVAPRPVAVGQARKNIAATVRQAPRPLKWSAAAAAALVLMVAGGWLFSRPRGERQPAETIANNKVAEDPLVGRLAGPSDALDGPAARPTTALDGPAARPTVSTDGPVARPTDSTSPMAGATQRATAPIDAADAPDPALVTPRALPTASPDAPAAAALAAEPPADDAPPRRRIRSKKSGELSGMARNYDDLQCRLIQSRHSTRVPGAAAIIEVDGDRLPLANPSALTTALAPALFLPRGRHAVRFRGNESLVVVSVEGDLLEEYRSMRDFFGIGAKARDDELLSRSARALDSHGAPMLLNLMGASLAAKEQWAAAERKFRRALRVNPCFSPAHLNLAWCLEKRGAKGEAARELRLAAMFNVGNVFGLAAPLHEMGTRLKADPRAGEPLAFDPAWYLSADAASLSDEDRRLTALLLALSKYAQLDAERAKILNNLGVHFADSGRAEIALDHFRGALAVLKQAGPERFALARQVLDHMSDTCRAAGLEEAEEYRRMRNLVSP